MATRIMRDDPHTPRFKRGHGPKRTPKFGPSRDRNYLAFVRARPCSVCGAPGPSHAHHHGPRGIGQKTDDFRTVPLCDGCHGRWHRFGHFDRPALGTRLQALEHVHATMVSLLVEWLRAMEETT